MTFTKCGHTINSSGKYTITNTTFINNMRALRISGNITIINCSFISHNSSAILIPGSINLNISSSLFDGNGNGVESGGCIDTSASGVRIESRNNRYINNYANHGGVVRLNNGIIIMENDYFFNNSAATHSGVGAFSGNATLRNCTFDSNKATNNGGVGNIAYPNPLLITNCTFINNSAGQSGGALALGTNYYRNMRVENSIFIQNRAGQLGGGVSVNFNPIAYIHNCQFIQNYASAGGGLGVEGSTSLLFLSCSTFDSNTANFGGAISVGTKSIMNISDSFVINNFAESFGGIHFSGSGNSSVTNCTFRNQTVSNNGGTVEVVNAFISISGSSFSSNGGNTVRVTSGSLFLSDTNFTNNGDTNYATSSIITTTDTIASITINNVQITGSESPLSIYVYRGSASIQDLVMSNNLGPLSVAQTSVLSLSSSSFINNRGGAIIIDRASADISTILCDGNTNSTNGGCLYCREGCNVTISNSNFTNNIAKSFGGALASEGRMTVTNCNIIQNKALLRGGGIWVGTVTAQATFSELSVGLNTAGSGAGIQIEYGAKGNLL